MALIKGILASFDNPLLGVVPTIVIFQYNPTEVTRTFRSESGESGQPGGGAALNAANPAQEEYSLKLELDATDGLEHEGPLTTAFGISPRLAALEMLMLPSGGCHRVRARPPEPGRRARRGLAEGRRPARLRGRRP